MLGLLNQFRRWVGLGLLLVGMALTTPLLTHYAVYHWQQYRLQKAWQQIQPLSNHNSVASSSPQQLPAPPPVITSPRAQPKQVSRINTSWYPAPLVGRISIPRMGLDDIILDGTSLNILQYGPGHLIGSAYPGQPGNSIIAAHDDVQFHTLGQLQSGDPVYVTDTQGKTYKYIVESYRVIGPQDVIALKTPVPTLTLSTCYPFNAYKDTPYRYIVTAHLVS